MDNVKTFNGDNFQEEVINAQGPVMVDVWAPWCGPCNAMTPVVADVARKYTVGKLNLDENMDLCNQYSVSAIPTFLFFKDGMLVDRRVGIQSSSDLKAIMRGLCDTLGSLEG